MRLHFLGKAFYYPDAESLKPNQLVITQNLATQARPMLIGFITIFVANEP